VEAASDVATFLSGISRSAFLDDKVIRSAVLQRLLVIGEAAASLPDEIRDRYPDVAWRDIIGFRNMAVHEYFALDWRIVWYAATEDVPPLRVRVVEIMKAEGMEP